MTRMMSASELRRYLLALFMLGGILLCYLFWNQPSTPGMGASSYTNNNAQKVYIPYLTKSDLRWSWECEGQRCVRKEVGKDDRHTSLATCSMLCGSTQLWPQPTGPVTLGSRSVVFNHQQFQLDTMVSEPARSFIMYSFAAFNSNVVNLVQNVDYTKSKSDIRKFVVKISVFDAKVVRLLLTTDESYKLVVRPNEDNDLVAMITAQNVFGARHALESLSQLIWWAEFENGGMLKTLRGASVQDAPKFPYRGLMVDTARNFMPVDNLKRVLVGMAANKLNVFHWHVSDSQSFPLELPNVPQLAKYGSYRPDLVYTVEQVKELVEFANLRGIRVVIEVDMPAHAGNGWTWGPSEGLGDLAVCVNLQPWSLYCGEPPCGQLNPDNPNVYDVLEKIFKDLLEMTGESEIFHMGGDEVNLECWAQYRNRNNTSSYVDLNEVWGNFTKEALKRLEKANGGKRPKHVVVWSSNLTKRPYSVKYFDKNSIVVQSWGGSEWTETPELVAGGYNVIISHVDAWYLDCGYGRWREHGEAACDPYRTWQTVYRHQPWNSDVYYRKQVLGGEACLWTEQVDEKSLDTRLWPRAAAFAERVWSDPPVDRSSMSINEDVYTRLSTHRDRLISRGLAAEALWPQWCSQNPGMCL
ncbi:PREDICTED: probable beta-hexosaminidase fdl isoform X2 [Nicrophorus vespilloides]|nr:PREDICTED: probable beta-hexosaminidase fdl isoform X2 [Nicrophorus vespilloides]XP_017781983.1 PREDICTED: probable beta-hexosaminidase fdl isoform X2 [Nicrophorus vespilloides]XP_017781984.1 PREDICTED: probable beta-hexosaminidase fdl isoform X2 [Nicrophorus vespilloides]XP_017781985.1 PREDICTED: probable beta-hexosaminidase fdl isoform X2 [Nicrophorus vespilloides]XP_017781986.1 PREDICTED: probable beta-hexosaminidase fdl isoform X2 [Nicrophorus vespilloides]